MARLEDIERLMAEEAVKIREGVGRIVRGTALAIDQGVVTRTPVDTGRARSNYIVSIDAPSVETREPYVPGSKGSSGAENANAAIRHGQGVIAGYKPDVNVAIFIVNNLDYIAELNQGKSAQAPAGFVESAVLDGVEAARKIKI